MNAELQHELRDAITSDMPLGQIVELLRRYKYGGIRQDQVYSFLKSLHVTATDEATDDRVLEIADFVAGFCAPHMKVWDSEMPEQTTARPES